MHETECRRHLKPSKQRRMLQILLRRKNLVATILERIFSSTIQRRSMHDSS
uniref:Uncharacterized protein n=1 Tax=Arundo donax TaxID=35708 RepID=A0A0A9B218_ARUDO